MSEARCAYSLCEVQPWIHVVNKSFSVWTHSKHFWPLDNRAYPLNAGGGSVERCIFWSFWEFLFFSAFPGHIEGFAEGLSCYQSLVAVELVVLVAWSRVHGLQWDCVRRLTSGQMYTSGCASVVVFSREQDVTSRDSDVFAEDHLGLQLGLANLMFSHEIPYCIIHAITRQHLFLHPVDWGNIEWKSTTVTI